MDQTQEEKEVVYGHVLTLLRDEPRTASEILEYLTRQIGLLHVTPTVVESVLGELRTDNTYNEGLPARVGKIGKGNKAIYSAL